MQDAMRADSINTRAVMPHEIIELVAIYNSCRAGVECYTDGEIDLQAFSKLVEGEEIHVALKDKIIAGFISIWAPERFIHHLYVAPYYQSEGIGGALLSLCISLYGLPLSLKCDCCNTRARDFYRKRGWVLGATGTGDYGPWEQFCLSRT